MKHNFCTLFDKYYLSRGITMYESLEIHCPDFHLFIFAFDNDSYQLLNERNLKYATIVSLEEFENDKLLSVKNDRTAGEYCWTATGSTIKYCIDTYSLNSCTYLDADLYFFSDPSILLKEVSDGSTLITEHRYTKKYDQSKSSGKYCVQFMTFHNNENSMKALNWWIESCIKWCYAKLEDGKFGDQKYLDDWTNRFNNIHELRNLGGGVAPWNVQQYNFSRKDNIISGIENNTGDKFSLVFFHFHALKVLEHSRVNLSSYTIKNEVVELIYKPYVTHLNKINSEYESSKLNIRNENKKINITYILKRLLNDKLIAQRFIKRKILGKSNIYYINDLLLNNNKET